MYTNLLLRAYTYILPVLMMRLDLLPARQVFQRDLSSTSAENVTSAPCAIERVAVHSFPRHPPLLRAGVF